MRRILLAAAILFAIPAMFLSLNNNVGAQTTCPPTEEPPPEEPPTTGPTITGTTYYVSPTGSDSNTGRSTTSAWRTVAKVNSAALNPGDGVRFQGGATFNDAQLSPSRSGTAASKIVYTTYGTGKASLPRGVYLYSDNGIALHNLIINGASQGILASGSGTGSDDILIDTVEIRNVGIAINSAQMTNARWTIRNSLIDETRDSGMIILGDNWDVGPNNTITDTGKDTSISYGKHGIYSKLTNSRITHNTIQRYSANGVSVRYRNTTVDNNLITDGAIGIAFFSYDSTAGTSNFRNNNILRSRSAGIYTTSDRTTLRESFVITGNRICKASGVHTNLKATTGTYTVHSNTLTTAPC